MRALLPQSRWMDLDGLLDHFFGTSELDDLDDAEIEAGREKVRIAFGTEIEPGRKFALWVILHSLGDAPDPAKAFEDDASLQAAAAEYARAVARAERG